MKFVRFRICNYRNVDDSGWINVGDVTAFVGQNEAGKSNLFEALYRINPFEKQTKFILDEDWPVDRWEEKDADNLVVEADFELSREEIKDLFEKAYVAPPPPKQVEGEPPPPAPTPPTIPAKGTLNVWRNYTGDPGYELQGEDFEVLDKPKLVAWVAANLPKFVFIRDYEIDGSRVELNELHQRNAQHGFGALSASEQTMLVVLDLAKIDVPEFLQKGATPEGRTTRTFDKKSASAYLSRQFNTLWRQKEVRFDIEIDGTTLNILVEDEGVGMPIRLQNRSTGFRWHVSFAWRFTHASKGQYKNCILLLEEPGIHLHYAGQSDLLAVFDRLAVNNQILYTVGADRKLTTFSG